MVQRSLDLLNTKGNQNDPRVIELKRALTDLKLDDIEVDVTSSQLMMHDEVTLLRKHIDSELNNVLRPNINHTTGEFSGTSYEC